MERRPGWSKTRIKFVYPWDGLAIRGTLMTAPHWIQSRLKLACRRRSESSCIDRMPKVSRRSAEDFFSRRAVLYDFYYRFAPSFVKYVFYPCSIPGYLQFFVIAQTRKQLANPDD